MRSVLLTLGALAAWAGSWHIGLLAILAYVWASAMASTTNSAKTRALEARLDALVPRIPVPQTSPGTFTVTAAQQGNTSYDTSNSSYSTSNSSYSVSGENTISAPGSGYSQTWAQEVQNTVGALFSAFNALQGSYSNTIPAFNALQGSYSNTIPALNTLRDSYSATVPQVNNLVTDHTNLAAAHNTLVTTLGRAGILQ